MDFRLISFFSFQVLLLFLQEARAETHNYNVTRIKGRKQVCNLFQGQWVVDTSYPVYDSGNCPFIEAEFDCQKYGRPDKQYLKYAWKPDSCSIPRFDGVKFLRRWRGKKIMFVGDSLSLNMWESLACMIHASVPNTQTNFVRRSPLSYVIFKDYGVTLYLYRTPYLVDIVKKDVGRVLDLNSIEGGNAWKDMDMLIFNSWHWWTHKGNSQGWDYIRNGAALYKDMNRLEAFYKGLSTWARWVDQSVNPTKTKVFFQGISPTHYQGREWNQPKDNCNGQLEPLSGSAYPGGSPPEVAVVNKVLSTIKKPVYLLDITTLSQLRKDAHPSAYSGDHSGNDCSHWCLPGLPDTWNQLLYAALFMYKIVEGDHALWTGVSRPYGETIRAFLVYFQNEILRRTHESFCFSNGSIGNFFFAGARIFFQSLDAAIFLFSRVSGIPSESQVLPVISTNDRFTLGCELMDGTIIRGQNEISHPDTGSLGSVNKERSSVNALHSRIRRVFYMSSEGQNLLHEVFPRVNPSVLEQLRNVDCVIYGMGSLFTSICPSLVLRGIGEIISSRSCPKVLLLNGTYDRETSSFSASCFITAIADALNRTFGDPQYHLNNPPSQYINTVLVPKDGEIPVDVEFLSSQGIFEVITVDSIHDRKVGVVFEPKSLIQALANLTSRSVITEETKP